MTFPFPEILLIPNYPWESPPKKTNPKTEDQQVLLRKLPAPEQARNNWLVLDQARFPFSQYNGWCLTDLPLPGVSMLQKWGHVPFLLGNDSCFKGLQVRLCLFSICLPEAGPRTRCWAVAVRIILLTCGMMCCSRIFTPEGSGGLF